MIDMQNSDTLMLTAYVDTNLQRRLAALLAVRFWLIKSCQAWSERQKIYNNIIIGQYVIRFD